MIVAEIGVKLFVNSVLIVPLDTCTYQLNQNIVELGSL